MTNFLYEFIKKIEKRAFYFSILIGCFLLYVLMPSIPYLNLEGEIFLTLIYSFVAVYFLIKLHLRIHTLLIFLIVVITISTLLDFNLFAEIITNVLYMGILVEVIHLLYVYKYEN